MHHHFLSSLSPFFSLFITIDTHRFQCLLHATAATASTTATAAAAGGGAGDDNDDDDNDDNDGNDDVCSGYTTR